jgi:hypothetical protein
MSLGGGGTLEALLVVIFSFSMAEADRDCRDTLLQALEVELGLGIIIAIFFKPTAKDVIAEGARESRGKS